MYLQHLELRDFRTYEHAVVELPDGLTLIRGANGQGKTNLVEAIAYLATADSFRQSPVDAMVRVGATQAIVRADITREDRRLQLEAEINLQGRNRTQVNRQPVRRTRDLLEALRVTVFAPDDLAVIKEGPSARRLFLDEALVAVHPRHDTVRTEVERVLRQRNALLKQAGGRLSEEISVTLSVWDQKLVLAGTALADAREDLLTKLRPVLTESYRDLAGSPAQVEARYEAPWRADGLTHALDEARATDVRRGVTTVGPHRDEVVITLHGLPARTHASQGEQRCLALALRLAVHRMVTEALDAAPVLVLDDVLSELDGSRADALLANLPNGQTILTTAGDAPRGTAPALELRVESGVVGPAR